METHSGLTNASTNAGMGLSWQAPLSVQNIVTMGITYPEMDVGQLAISKMDTLAFLAPLLLQSASRSAEMALTWVLIHVMMPTLSLEMAVIITA